MVKYTCGKCYKEFNRKSNYDYHISDKKKACVDNSRIFQNIPNSNILQNILNIPNTNKIIDNTNCNICNYCEKSFSTVFNLNKHSRYNCKLKKEDDKTKENIFELLLEKIEKKKDIQFQTEINQLKNIIEKQNNKIEKILKLSCPINDKLFNIISNKNKQIDELKNNITFDTNIKPIINNKNNILIINDTKISHREIDNYINATELCKAGDKQFSHWISLDSTKELINELEKSIDDTQIKVNSVTKNKSTKSNENNESNVVENSSSTTYIQNKLIEINIGGNDKCTWIHPDLAIQLAQWISSKFALQVSRWIRELCTNNKIELDQKLKLKDEKIKLLEDNYIKKQKRTNYPDKNVIYILTTEDNKKKRIYIIGKAVDLKKRLSTYNKTCEHEVIFYNSCESEEDMELIEKIVLNKLKDNKEKANRDRFILPENSNINFFIDTIKQTHDFFYNNNDEDDNNNINIIDIQPIKKRVGRPKKLN